MTFEPVGRPPGEQIDITTGAQPPVPPPPPRPQTVRVALIATVLLAASAIAATIVGDSDEPAMRGVAIGDCVAPFRDGQIEQSGEQITSAPAEAVDCAGPDAAYRVALQAGSAYVACPSPSYRVRRVGVGTPDERTLCMTYNVRSDQCFVEAPPEAAGPYDCGLGPRPGAIHVLRVVEGVEDPMRCTGLRPELSVVTVPEPATTFCYVQFGENQPDVRTV